MEVKAGLTRIRLTLPFWGKQYAQRVVSLTLPALLAPDNLPALAEDFPVEVSLVTEAKLFDLVSTSRAFRRLQEFAEVRLVPIDDLLTGVAGDYGPVLTFALIRGFQDLGERMLDYYLMFLNADFVLANGSYRTLGRLIKKGHRVIHCPSFRGIYEEVVPALSARLDQDRAILSMAPREMVDLALRNKHVTVKARIVNQKLTHQWRMDQFYWYVNESTLIGYQWPVALVALKPERVVTRPKLMFDYGFIPDICPTAEKYYIGDSDEFFMLEPQKRATGKDLVRLGWISQDHMAADLSLWTTKEHRECGRQMHVFHSAELPEDMSAVVEESRTFMRELHARLGPPNSHIDHPLFKSWWTGVLSRMEDRRAASAQDMKTAQARPDQLRPVEIVARKIYRWIFGGLPRLYPDHPLWLETYLLNLAFEQEYAKRARILWVSEAQRPLQRLAARADVRASPSELLASTEQEGLLYGERFDACFFELTMSECRDFRRLYERARAAVGHGGRVYLGLSNLGWWSIAQDDIDFCETVLPDTDESEVQFGGGRIARLLRHAFNSYIRVEFPRAVRPFIIGALLIALAPLTYLGNRRAAHPPSGAYRNNWTHLFARFKVMTLPTSAGAAKKPKAEQLT